VHLRSSSQALEGDDRVFRITRQTKLRGPTDCVMFAVSYFCVQFLTTHISGCATGRSRATVLKGRLPWSRTERRRIRRIEARSLTFSFWEQCEQSFAQDKYTRRKAQPINRGMRLFVADSDPVIGKRGVCARH
jgi:hypothetical protein